MTNTPSFLKPSVAAMLCALTLGVCATTSAQAQSAPPTTTLTPAKDRISDQAIAADQAAYEQLQSRIHAINEGGRPVRDYHLSKSQCWLDVSLHEYTRNDRSAFPQEAMTESEKLIKGMEAKVSPLPMDTPLVNGAARLRPDLWERAIGLRKHAGWACAQQKAACAEVELVHAGNEHNQQQWRHAKPYVQIAEDLVGAAESAANACVAADAARLAALAAAKPPAPLPASTLVDLSASVVFNFDRFTANDIRAFSQDGLKNLVEQAKTAKVRIDKIRLVGHADRLNSTGQRDYNEQLSRKRAETIRQWLVDAGLPAALISFEYVGDTQQVVQCQGKYKSTFELEECLLPNRRVEVRLQGLRAP